MDNPSRPDTLRPPSFITSPPRSISFGAPPSRPSASAPPPRSSASTLPPPSNDEPAQESSSGSRRLGENLAPLIQFLHKNIGRRWSDVHAEICKLISPGSAAQKHVLEHVSGLVATSVLIIDGKPHRPVGDGVERSRCRALTGAKWDSLYVCPTTGILRSVERARDPLRKVDPDVRPVGPLSQYRRINGSWYLVELAFIPSLDSALPNHYDVLLHAPLSEISSEDMRRMYGSYDRYAVSKRALGKREILRLSDVLA